VDRGAPSLTPPPLLRRRCAGTTAPADTIIGVNRLAHPAWCENLIEAGGLKEGERVLVVVDEPLLVEGSELAAAVKDAGGEPRLELWSGERPLQEPPQPVLDGGTTADLSFFISQAPRGGEAAARFPPMETRTRRG